MNSGTLDRGENIFRDDAVLNTGRIVEFEHADAPGNSTDDVLRTRRSPFRLFHEFRRRRVCRAATTYSVALWLICQVIEVVSPELGLPEWTLRFVIVLGLLGFPVALVISWIFEVTPSGLVLDRDSAKRRSEVVPPRPRCRSDQVIDCGLLAVALAIGLQLALASMGPTLLASTVPVEELSVQPFLVTSEKIGNAFSGALRVELQHKLAGLHSVKVVVPRDPMKLITGSRLTGSVAILEEETQVTVVVIDNRTGEVTWSDVLTFPGTGMSATPRDVAIGIATALANWSSVVTQTGGDHDRPTS